MKTTFKFIITLIAASAVLSSCVKEMALDNTAGSTGEARVISASFSAPTKSALDTDNKTPIFVGGETIKVSNDTKSEDCTISVTGGVATFSTTLTGTLTAIYPSTAAKMKGNVIDETAVLVSTVQDGTFASANIAMATGITTSATFTNKTAVIKITPGAGENTKYVEVITAGSEIANTASGEYTKLNKIHVASTSADAVYVSILVPEGLKVRDLSFADGHNIKTAKNSANAIAVNTLSTVSNADWNTPYVEIEMTVNSETRKYKWATVNIGANIETEAGEYFMWGYTVGHTASTSGTDAFNNQTFKEGSRGDNSKGFAWDNYIKFTTSKYSSTSKKVFTKYIPTTKGSEYWKGSGKADNKTVLDLADDAANANWGGSWRMPTKEEFDALALLKRGEFNSGSHFGTSDDAQIFIPAVGYGNNAGLYRVDEQGHYWSSSLDAETPTRAYYLNCASGTISTTNSYRYFGRPVRALSD